MTYHNPSDKWDNREKEMDEPEEPAKVEVQVNTGQQPEEIIPPSGIFCIYCEDIAVHIYEGNSLCRECFNKERADLIKERRKKQ